MEYNYTIQVNEKACTGCKACQLACSFHRSGCLDLEDACLRIERDGCGSRITATFLAEFCDMCPEETVPYCIKFCAADALSIARRKKDLPNN